jgi:hypothetical protein
MHALGFVDVLDVEVVEPGLQRDLELSQRHARAELDIAVYVDLDSHWTAPQGCCI